MLVDLDINLSKEEIAKRLELDLENVRIENQDFKIIGGPIYPSEVDTYLEDFYDKRSKEKELISNLSNAEKLELLDSGIGNIDTDPFCEGLGWGIEDKLEEIKNNKDSITKEKEAIKKTSMCR